MFQKGPPESNHGKHREKADKLVNVTIELEVDWLGKHDRPDQLALCRLVTGANDECSHFHVVVVACLDHFGPAKQCVLGMFFCVVQHVQSSVRQRGLRHRNTFTYKAKVETRVRTSATTSKERTGKHRFVDDHIARN